MKALYLFHDDWTQWVKADLAASMFPFEAFVVVRQTRPWWGRYLWKRARRIGFGKVLDEVLFRLYYTAFQAGEDKHQLSDLFRLAKGNIPATYRRPPVFTVDDINSAEAHTLLEKLQPDVCVLMLNVLVKPIIFTIPPKGMLVFHPGVVPEYRGAHSAFWAVLNGDRKGIGWSLLTVNAGVDTGAVVAQGISKCANPLRQSHVVMQHFAHLDGTAGLVDALRAMEGGETPKVATEGRASCNYTHPGLTDYWKYRRQIREWQRSNEKCGCA
ncbi:MAG: formyltransferase family protein [Bryobacteraceae bacterium]